MFDKSVYINRRKQLIDKMSGGLVLILGNEEAPANYPSNTYKFRQDSSFLYFFGLNMPGFAGLMDADSGESYSHETTIAISAQAARFRKILFIKSSFSGFRR